MVKPAPFIEDYPVLRTIDPELHNPVLEQVVAGNAAEATRLVTQQEQEYGKSECVRAQLAYNRALAKALFIEPKHVSIEYGSVHRLRDPLDVYLRDTGDLELLSREEEIEIVRSIEAVRKARNVHRMGSPFIAEQLLKRWEQVRDGEAPFERTLDIRDTEELSKEQMTRRLPHNIQTITELLARQHDESLSQNRRLQDRTEIGLLADEIRPRDKEFKKPMRQLHEIADRMQALMEAQETSSTTEERQQATCELQLLCETVQETPDSLQQFLQTDASLSDLLNRCQNALVSGSLRLVINMAKEYRNRGVDFLDLIGEGNIGLMYGATKFEHRRGYKFGTYATWWVRQKIHRAVVDTRSAIRIPASMSSRHGKIRRCIETLVMETGREPSIPEIMEATGESHDVILSALHIGYVSSLDTPIGGNGDSCRGDFVAGREDQAAEIDRRLLKEQVDEALSTLPPRERHILIRRFGLSGDKPQTLEEVGNSMKVTRERIRQLEARALKKLGSRSGPKGLRSFSDFTETDEDTTNSC